MTSIEKYFNGESVQSIVGIIIGTVFILVSIYLYNSHKALFKGLSYSTIPLSVILIIISTNVINKAPNNTKRVKSCYYSDRQLIKKDELPRMEKVMNNFSSGKTFQLALLLGGLIFMIIFWKNELVRGIIIGIILQLMLLFIFDYKAELRGAEYLEFLQTI